MLASAARTLAGRAALRRAAASPVGLLQARHASSSASGKRSASLQGAAGLKSFTTPARLPYAGTCVRWSGDSA